MSLIRFPLVVASVCSGFAALACGPSVQLIYEGNIRFEHCYRLDFDEQIAPTHRKACWVEWNDNYSNGQTRDRVEYGKRRIEALSGGEGIALALHLDQASDAGAPAILAGPAPMPIDAHSPPPSVLPAAAILPVAVDADAGVVADPPAGDISAATVPAKGSGARGAKSKGTRATASGPSPAVKPKP